MTNSNLNCRARSWRRWVPLTLLCPLLLSACREGQEDVEQPPNVLLLFIDDLGWRDLGCYGSTFYETPNIDRLAAEGATFTSAYSACPVCSPSRGAFLTGRSPARTGLTGHINPTGAHRYPAAGPIVPPDDFTYLPASEVTIAEALEPFGYESLSIGKWHVGGAEEHSPEAQGFDTAIAHMAGGARDAPLHHYTYFFPFFDKSRSPDFQIPGMEGGEPGDYLTDRITDEALSWLENRDASAPFLLYLSHYAVHTPLEGPEPLVRKYEEKLQTDDSQKSAVYGAMVENLDTNIGRVLDAVDQAGLADQTIVIFASDNGGTTRATDNSPLREGKGYLYEGGIRVPMIVKWPGVTRPGTEVDVPVISHDVFPTVLEMVAGSPGAPEGPVLDGRSLVPLLTGEGGLDREVLYWYYPHYSPQAKRPGAAIRAGQWKLIENYDPPGLELFDLGDDLGEQRNLAEARPEKAAALRKRLYDELEAAGARLHQPNPAHRPGE
jgi:arylsulfatase A-like enzyme